MAVGSSPRALTASAAVRLIANGELSSEELVRSCLERIAERDGDVRAWVHLDVDLALSEAKERDSRPVDGPLHGVPIGVKDIIDTADRPTTYGARPYEGHRPAVDAVSVQRLRQAGAVVLGKTVTTEFACFHPGPTANPHDLTRTPGGSSSGSAAAVADGMVPVALGTQTAGSVVRPASFCGIFGLKPTYAALPLGGVKAVSPSLDTLGVLARDAEDCALVAGVLADDPNAFRPPATETLRIGFVRTAQWPWMDADAREIIGAAVERLAAGGIVAEAELPPEFAGLAEAQEVIMAVEAADALGPDRREHGNDLSDDLLRFLDRGHHLRWAHESARGLAARCRRLLPRVFADHDVLLAPSVLGEPPPREESTGDPLLCRAWTLLGTPCVAVPGLRGRDGLPLGVQIVAAPGADGLAVRAASLLADWLTDRAEDGSSDD